MTDKAIKAMKREQFKKRIYEVIEAATSNDPASKMYDIMLMIAVIVSLLPLTMRKSNIYTTLVDIVTLAIFIFDYGIRVYTSDYKMGVKSFKAYLYYIRTPMAIIDLICIIPILSFIFPNSNFLNILRVFRVLRILKLTRYSKTMRTIVNVIKKVKQQLLAVLILTFAYILGTAMFIYQIEPGLFQSFFDAVYWAAISITTIGYGDISPVTTAGRTVTMISALVGVAVIALPSGIITAAYMEEITKKKGKHEL